MAKAKNFEVQRPHDATSETVSIEMNEQTRNSVACPFVLIAYTKTQAHRALTQIGRMQRHLY